MDSSQQEGAHYPAALVDWAGHHSGGVKRLLDQNSGQPNKQLLRTNLLSRLQAWAKRLPTETSSVPRIVLLVGGPGNGKTEAIESTIRWLDESLGCDGRLVDELSKAFHPPMGSAVPRLARVDAGSLARLDGNLSLDIVQDASATAGHEGSTAPALLIEELGRLLDGPPSQAYLCCVNRGVLDDALIHAIDNDLEQARALLEAITRAVSLAYDAPSCWPLEGFPSIAVWPMDAESLLVKPDDEPTAPAEILLGQATASGMWPARGTCPAGDKCPFCSSQAILARDEHKAALLRILRWYELASGKRWSFRDLFSLTSYLLAGHHPVVHDPAGTPHQSTPCQWAANLVELDQKAPAAKRPSRQSLTAIFHLATSSYQHALFHRWDRGTATSLRRDLKDLGLEKELDREEGRTLMGLVHFLAERKGHYLPATIAPLLEGLVDTLDPAFASPDSKVAVSSRNTIVLGELDMRFSRSLEGGIEFIRKYQVLSPNELEILKRLSAADTMLSFPVIRRKRPVAASRVQHILRDFACRLARRSICTRTAVVADAPILQAFQQVVEDSDKHQHLFEVVRQVKELLNTGKEFEVSLTTTFGQPLPPRQRQATLVVPQSPVRMFPQDTSGRPHPPICYLRVGQGQSAQPVPLTYDLFKAVKELERGLSPASLPRTVVALLDTTKARLSGPIVRDQGLLDDARIRVGADGTVVGRSWNGFVESREDGV
ncbi:TPA: ATP-binding protein [Pseudomonas aeruginosa]|uniref:ATP-binding protein n=1 Tax=Pseudomonas aeruginosa TaxID=287 RepID=UPI0003B99D8A|nr:ATP-binding protein [Pseudomonas aeruginosa]KEA14293.1 hypothetical protein Y905_25735 [Pseudomonas aeruginosa C2159M]ERY84279.1 hypothetical protein Q028_00879 [Pseudomonas aeruginosa BWHPSA015]KEI24506.1 hypothetical protein CH80_29390 [Pseudomonas aeruginosa]KQC50256.1 hypothetical protein APG04_20585 [Pseudomonas aeruginosa]KQC56112.1 hypothetical protein APG03_25425 [Pseudomonas aeruginosa]